MASGYPFSTSKSFATVPFPLTAVQAAPPTLPAALPAALTSFADPHLKLPLTHAWNVALEQSIGPSQSLSVTYVGNISRRLLRIDGSRITNNPNFAPTGQNSITRNAGSASYNALQIQFQRRLAHGLQALAGYTWSHSIDNASTDILFGAVTPSIFADTNKDRGDSDWDVRHTFTSSVTYNIPTPWRNKVLRAVLGNWSLDNLFIARSAPPLNLLAASVITNGSIFSNRPNLIQGTPVYLYGPQYAGGKIINNTPPTAAQIAAAG